MRYRNCPNCGSSNHVECQNCYSCEQPLPSASPVVNSARFDDNVDQSGEFRSITEDPKATFTAFIAIALSSICGGGMGYFISRYEIEMPFFLEEVLLGTICAVITAFCLAKLLELPEGLVVPRLLPAGGFGALVGVCLYAIWWSLDPPVGLTAVGAIAGVCAAVPITVSFGLFGGESAPLGMLEFGNVLGGLVVGFFVAIWFGLEIGDIYWIPGIMGICGLLPTFAGGRLNPATGSMH